MVLMRLNIDEIEDMITFLQPIGAELKLIELLEFQVPDKAFWSDNFVDPMEIRPLLESIGNYKGLEWGESGFGAPMDVFDVGGTKVLVYRSAIGTHYGDICGGCVVYPCQDGLYGLRVTHDGKLKPCWGRNDNLTDILMPLRLRDTVEVTARFRSVLDVYEGAKFKRCDPSSRGRLPNASRVEHLVTIRPV